MTRVDILPVLAECYYYNRKGSTIIRLEVVLGYRGVIFVKRLIPFT
jgi:hypothetical protein